jgi:hypothetical protein
MDDRIVSIISGSLTKSCNLTRLSSTDIPKLIKKRSAHIRVARGSLQYIYTLFNDGEDIWQDQCDRAIIIMTTLSEPIQTLCEMWEEAISSIVDIAAPYNEFLALLYHFDEQLQRLIALMKVFRSICRTSSIQVKKKRQEIIYKLNLFIESYDDILESVRYLSEETQPGHILHTFSEAALELPTSGETCSKEYRYTLRQSAEKKTGPIGGRQEHPHLKVVRESYVEELHAPGIKLED